MNLIPDKKKPSIPRQHLEEYNILIFSEPGLGKTSFVNAFNDCMLVLFENSAKSILSNDVNLSQKVETSSQYSYEWQIFKDTISQFMQGGHEYKTFGVDTITRAYDSALSYMMAVELNGIHPSVLQKDDDYSGYSLLNGELKNVFSKILNSNYGTILSAHASYKKIKDLKGVKEYKLIPDTGGSFGKWIMGEVDIIIFLTKNEKGDRVFYLEQGSDFDAKQRLPFENNEIVIETKKLNPGKHAYETFKKEFDKAIKRMNKSFGITQDMIDECYKDEKKQKEIANLQQEIISKLEETGITPAKNRLKLKEIVGVTSVMDIDKVESAKKYLDYLKNK